MTTVARIIDHLASSARGRVFLVNLKATLDDGFDPQPLRRVCRDLALTMNNPVREPVDADQLTRDLGMRCVKDGLWLNAKTPDLKQFAGPNGLVLSRVMTYGKFYRHVLPRACGPQVSGWKLPAAKDGIEPDLNAEQIASLREFLSSGAWRRLVESTTLPVRMMMHCVWMLPLDQLTRRAARSRRPLADFYRDVIGLSDIEQGSHLVRLDFDFDQWQDGQALVRRRPHGAGNGGDRFRVLCDGPPNDDWGRTVNLGVVAARRRHVSMNGVPEILMEPFEVPPSAVQACYIGQVSTPPERNHRWFLGRISPTPMQHVISALKETLA